MTVGRLISLLCNYASDVNELIMCEPIGDIEIRDDHAILYFIDSNTENKTLYEDGHWEYRRG